MRPLDEAGTHRSESGASLNAVGILLPSGRGGCQWATQGGHLAIVNLLVEKGVNVNKKDKDGAILIHWAAKEGHLELVEYLIKRTNKINEKDDLGATPLHRAVEGSLRKIVERLLNSGADINRGDKYGLTPFHWAVGDGNLKLEEYLIDWGAKRDKKDKSGWTPFNWADSKVFTNNLIQHMVGSCSREEGGGDYNSQGQAEPAVSHCDVSLIEIRSRGWTEHSIHCRRVTLAVTFSLDKNATS